MTAPVQNDILDTAKLAATQVISEGHFSIACAVGFHRWSQWNCIEHGQVLNAGTKQSVGNYEVQRRACHRCGKAQMHTERTSAVEKS